MLYELRIFCNNKKIFSKKIFAKQYKDLSVFILRIIEKQNIDSLNDVTVKIFKIEKFDEFYHLLLKKVTEEKIRSQLNLSVYKFNQFKYYYNYLNR